MRCRLNYLYCFLLLLFTLPAIGQSTSNKGTVFWTTFAAHMNLRANANPNLAPPNLTLYLTGDLSTTGTVSIPGEGYSESFNITPGRITKVAIPRNESYVGGSDMIENKGILITSEAPIAVYSHIHVDKRSGATLVLPAASLGQEYRAVTFYYNSQFSIIATEDNTLVEITPTADTEGGHLTGEPFTVELQTGEVYQVKSDGDLTGSRISTILPENGACKNVAVYSGNDGVQIDQGNNGFDNLYQQLFPYNSWGMNYMVIPMKDRPYDFIRIVAGEAGANVSINGESYSIPPNDYMQSPQITAPVVIEADEPILVAQFTPSQQADPRNRGRNYGAPPPYIGDPDMVLLSPIEQTLEQITLFSTPAEKITKHFINVVIPTDEAATFTVDGSSRGSEFEPIPNQTSWSYAQLAVGSGTHQLAAAGGFIAIAYGYGNFESYGYLAGTNLIDFSRNITHETGPDIYSGSEGCNGRTLSFGAELDFNVLSFQWDFGDGTTSPLETDTSLLSHYKHTYTQSGIYTARLTVTSDEDICGNSQQLVIPYEFEVDMAPHPVPDFSIPVSCVEDAVVFENLSSIEDNTPMTYTWDFGDGSAPVSGEQPSHRFPSPGIYQVTLIATSQYGCESAPITKNITINSSDPESDFSMPASSCMNEAVQFSDQSRISFGSIGRWEWDFNGEGSSEEQHPVFQFSTPGEKTITLRAYSGVRCFDVIQKTITIHAVTQPIFQLPAQQARVCANEPAYKITGFYPADGDNGGHGELTAGTGLDENGIFHPDWAGPGQHEIVYTFTNAEGCRESASQTIIVNAIPEIDAGTDRQILEGRSTLLNASSNGSQFEWSPADGLDNPFILQPTASPDETTTYTLRVMNAAGCSVSDQITVEVLDLLIIPNAFSPNADGINDLWTIGKIEDYPECTVQIYNRYGDRVFFSRGYAEPWDGTQGNQQLPPATYYYVIKPNRVHPEISGSVTIIR